MDRGANRAIVVGVFGRVLCGRGRGAWRFRARYPIVCRAGAYAIEMDVPERQRELQRQRDERQPAPNRLLGRTHRIGRTYLPLQSTTSPTAHNATGTKRASIGTISVRVWPRRDSSAHRNGDIIPSKCVTL